MSVLLGIDVGSRMTKAVVLPTSGHEADGLLSWASVMTHFDLADAARRAADAALEEAGVGPAQVDYTAATGYGRYQVEGRDIQITEMTCHARGAVALMPGIVSLIDVGAQNARAIRLAPNGRVLQFRMNDKCASGAGRFVERVAKALEVDLEKVSDLALQSTNPCDISSICAVLAESEVINHVTNGESIPDILQGTHASISDRLTSLIRQVGAEEPFAITGGVARNEALIKALSERLQMDIRCHPKAEFAGAIGAALLGRSRLQARALAAH